jgi:hypothetical protein
MKKKTAHLTVATILSLVICSSTFALSPMGPSKAMLEQEQWSLSFEFEYTEMDLETSSNYRTETINGIPIPPTLKSKYEIEELQSDMFFANIGLGISENWDIYMRLGMFDAQADVTEIQTGSVTGDQYEGFDGSHGFNLGIGTRATFFEDEDVSWGGLLQAHWANPHSSKITCAGDPYFSGKAELEYWDIQMAVGPTLELDYYRIYGGPFLYFVYGDIELEGTGIYPGPTTITLKSSKDIKEDAQFGGYVGAQFYLAEDSSLYTECQFTSDAWGLGFGITWKY